MKSILSKLEPKNRAQLFYIFTILFTLTLILTYLPFLLTNTSFLNNDDGFLQHYETLAHLKHVVSQLLSGKGFSFWSWSIGLGADTVGSLATVYTDPFNYIAILFPKEYISAGYTVEIYLQLYAVGLGFLYFGKVTNMKLSHTLWGAIAYALSSWGILAATKHNCFVTVMFLFILVMAGVEKILRHQSPLVLIITAALSAVTYLYFAYMTAIIVFLYILIHFIMKEQKSLKNYFVYWGKFILYALTAVCLAAIIIIPVIYILMNALKENASSYTLLHPFRSYLSYFSSFIGGQEIFGHYSTVSICPLFLLALPSVFHRIRTKKATPAMITFLSCLIFLLFPFINSVFNGFSYPVGRWCYAFAFFYIWSGLQILEGEHDTLLQTKKHIILMLSSMTVLLILVERVIFGLNSEVSVITAVINLFFAYVFYQIIFRQNAKKHLCSVLITIVLICNTVLIGWTKFSPGSSSALNGYSRHGEIYTKMEYSTQNAGTEIKDRSFYRVDQIDYSSMTELERANYLNDQKNVSYRPIHTPPNETLVFNTRSIYTYLSTVPGSLLSFNRAVGNNASYFRRICTYNNDNRARLDFLMGVKYFLGNNPHNDPPEGANEYASSHFSFNKKSSKGVNILKNKYSIGLGCVFDSYMTESEWLTLNYPDREQALMQCVVLPDDVPSGMKHLDSTNISSGSVQADWHISYSDNIRYNGQPPEQVSAPFQSPGRFSVSQANGYFTLHLDKEYKNCELYLVAHNIKRQPDSIPDLEREPAIITLQNRIKAGDDYGDFAMNAKMGEIEKKAANTIGNPQGLNDIPDLMINLGRYHADTKEITVSFDSIGDYSYDSIELLAVPLSTYKTSAKICSDHAYRITTLTDNYVKGTVAAPETDSMLYLSIPFNDGWKAYIDGKETPTQQIDTAFTGIPISNTGTHTVELRFRPVGFRLGILLFLAGLVSCICISLWYIIRRKHGSGNGH